MRVSNHGKKRSRQRVGIPSKSVHKNAEKAYEQGIGVNEAKGSLLRWMNKKLRGHPRKGTCIKIHHNHAYFFRQKSLVTVIPLPQQLNKIVQSILKKRKPHPDDEASSEG